MKRSLKIGIAYDVKEDYRIESNEWKYSDFSTLLEIGYIKNLFQKRGHTVYLLGNYEKIYQSLKDGSFPSVDIVFNTAEGIKSRNREGWIPSLLEINRIPYSGTDAFGLSLSLSKLHTKLVARYLGISTPDFCEIVTLEDIQCAAHLQGPWILKPNYEGSSSGVFFAEDIMTLQNKAAYLLKEYHQPILCETYISGREANVSLIYDGSKTKVIGAVEVIRKDGNPLHVFSAQDKFSGTCTKIAADFPTETLDAMYESAIKLHKHLGCMDYNRADFRVDNNNKPYFLELNPAPGVSEDDSFTLCCELHGLKMDLALEEIVFNAIDRFEKARFIQKSEE